MAFALMRLGLAAVAACAGSFASAQAVSDDGDLKIFAVHINRTPPQPWPGYGIYLGNGFVLTASHVPGNFAETKPHVLIAGQDLPASLVKEGALATVDLTLMSIDATKLPVRLRMSRMPLCERAPFAGETVVVAIPEGTARSHVLPPIAVPADLRGRFDTVIGDVATTGNSGSGVFDAWKQCLLGIMSRKISGYPPWDWNRGGAQNPRHREILCSRPRHQTVYACGRFILAPRTLRSIVGSDSSRPNT